MVDIRLTASECRTLDMLLSVGKTCESICWMGYKSIGCKDEDKEGNPRCKLLKNIEIIRNKLVKVGGIVE